MKKNIKQITEVSWTAIINNGNILKGEKKRLDYEHDFIKEYNSIGKLTEAKFYGADGTLLYKTFYEYYELENKIEEITIHSSGGENRLIKTYNQKGDEVEEAFYVDGDLNYITHKAYLENGQKVESVYHNISNNQKSKTVWINDENHNNIEMLGFNYDGSLDFKRLSKYDERGNGIEWAHYNQDGKLESRYKRKVDSRNNEIEWITDYDCDLNDSEYLKKSWIYKYDENDNWIEKIYFENNVPKGILEREITYYD